jgi:hypothetical protein
LLTLSFWGFTFPAGSQHLDRAQAFSHELAAFPIPSDISINGKADAPIPRLLGSLKREIRNWIGEHLRMLPRTVDPPHLRAGLVRELRKAGLFDSGNHDQKPFGDILGLGVSAVPGEPSLLRVVVSYDGFCPPDDSVLFFEHRTDRGWGLLLNFDNTGFDHPAGDREVLYAGISPRDEEGQIYAFIVRTRSYCPSSGGVMNRINYHVLRPSGDPDSEHVVLSGEHGYREEGDFRIELTKDAITMDFPDRSITASIWRTHILKYSIGRNSARRIEPVAVNAAGFVEEWITSPWSLAAEWSEMPDRSALRKWHERLGGGKLDRPKVFGDIAFRQTCSRDRKLMQITFPSGYPADGPKNGDVFFLVREVAPHQYRLVSVASQPAPGCGRSEPDESQGEHLLPESMNRRTVRVAP